MNAFASRISNNRHKFCIPKNLDYYYEILVVNGTIKHAYVSLFGQKIFNYSRYNKDETALIGVIVKMLIYPGIHLEKLKELYLVLDDGPEKDLVKSIQECLIRELTF